MTLMMILNVPKNQDSTLALKNTFLEKPQGDKGSEVQIDIQLFLPIQSVLSMNLNSPIRKLMVQFTFIYNLQFDLFFLMRLRKQIV